MYPNLKAEMARKGITLEKLAEELEKKGFARTIPTLSVKLSGKSIITLEEAKAIKEVLDVDIPIEELFEVAE